MYVQVFICVGILVAYLVGLPYRNNMPQHAYIGGSDVAWWRVMLALGLIPAALQVLPFSPKRLLASLRISMSLNAILSSHNGCLRMVAC